MGALAALFAVIDSPSLAMRLDKADGNEFGELCFEGGTVGPVRATASALARVSLVLRIMHEIG
jgi:hypothetical protein